MNLTTNDLQDALASPDHNGYGYACVRRYHGDAFANVIDQLVIEQANRMGLSPADLFLWANSKYGRYLADSISVTSLDEIGRQLNRQTIERLTRELQFTS